MNHKDYNKMILKHIEPSFNVLIPIAAFIMIFSSILISFSSIPSKFIYINGIFGILFIIITLLKNKLDIEFKILITMSLPTFIGVNGFIDGGFSSSLISLIMISNIIAVLLLPKRSSSFVSTITIMILSTLAVWSVISNQSELSNIGVIKWIIQILIFILTILLLHKMVYAIKNYLILNIERLEDSIAKTYELAYFDELTGLPNQIKFKEILFRKTNNHKTTGTLVFLSLKNLNLINSIYGDEIGNKVLIETTKILNFIKSNTEILARIAGNEYALWIDNNDDAKKRIDAILIDFHHLFDLSYMTKKIEFYISYAHHNKKEDILMACYHKCAIALTFAKTHKTDHIVAYDKKFDEIIGKDETLKEQLANALDSNEFELHYQAQVNAISGQVIGVEALARWHNNLLGNIPPNLFIPVLETINQTTIFGEYVVKQALSDYKKLCSKYHNKIKLAINISPSHLISAGFVDFINKSIIESGISSDIITLEITEEILIEGIDIVIELINSLKAIGVNISLDDFGSGYSSLNYLTNMNINELKIDKSFVDQIESNEKMSIMLEYLVKMAKDYKLNIIAEGVETKEQCDQLLAIGFTQIQGYYFSKPEPLKYKN